MNDLPPGALDLLVLQTLRAGALHGYALARRIQAASDDVLTIEEGTLYPALHRMERQGWLEAAWDRTDTGRRAKFYSITRSGRARLKKARTVWERTNAAIARVLEAEPA
ncbi:MAG: PadR family transcriptional regulator [bacterium]|nr:PadR family transcriptional regulator [bacterium]